MSLHMITSNSAAEETIYVCKSTNQVRYLSFQKTTKKKLPPFPSKACGAEDHIIPDLGKKKKKKKNTRRLFFHAQARSTTSMVAPIKPPVPSSLCIFFFTPRSQLPSPVVAESGSEGGVSGGQNWLLDEY